MLSVSEALHRVLEHSRPKPSEQVRLADAVGLVLAEDVDSDVDSPPHDKSIVDGYAVRSADLANGYADLQVLEEITAGRLPTLPITPGQCSRIMTGAPMPVGADSAVMVERTQLIDSQVQIDDERFRPGQNVLRQGASLRKGEIVLRDGAELGPAEIGLLAEVGRANVQAVGPVNVAILATGNELAPHDRVPAAGQIRNSNGPMLAAAVRRAGGEPIELGIGRDDAAELQRLIAAGLKHDVLVLSGGVSAGVLDLVPGVLAELGVEQVFHKIRLKPGKPLWFGVWRSVGSGEWGMGNGAGGPVAQPLNDEKLQQSTSPAHPFTPSPVHSPLPTPRSPLHHCLVFGLPGNPVSSFVCFELFVKPAIARLAGRPWKPPHPTQPAKLSTAFQHRGDRPTYHPAVTTHSPDGLLVEPTAWQGSADLRGFAGANALIAFPAGDRAYAPGETVETLPL